MYVAVKGGEKAVKNTRDLVAKNRRGDLRVPRLSLDQITNQLGLGVDRVMAEGSLYDRFAAAAAVRQAQGDLTEAVFLLRALRTTLKRFGTSVPVQTTEMTAFRRVSGIFKDIPGGQVLGPTYDYTLRLIEPDSDPDLEDGRNADRDEDQHSGQNDMDHISLDGPGRHHRNTPRPGRPTADDPGSPPPGGLPRVIDILQAQGLMTPNQPVSLQDASGDITRQPLTFPAPRSVRLQALARGDEGFSLGAAYSLQRGFGLDRHPFLGELKVGYVSVRYTPPELGFEIHIGRVTLTECPMVNRQDGAGSHPAGFETGYGLVFGQNERKAMSMSLLDRSLSTSEKTGNVAYPAQDPEFVLSHCDSVESSGFVQHLKLPHYVDFQSELVFIRNRRKEQAPDQGNIDAPDL
ncbi:MAG TPA: carbon-phosphorus lyase complex subunit PhnI [Desulfotignum sp.]|nr:carbon-phosphorus lyase complex subunit PhnI [Desulfotignum sp.]